MNCKRLWWIGIKLSDISGVEHLFEGAIALIGSKSSMSINFVTFEEKYGKQINHNSRENFKIIDQFYKNEITKLTQKDSSICFFWHDQINFSEDDFFFSTSKYNNDKSILDLLSNKLIIRSILSRHVPVIPHIQLLSAECDYQLLSRCFPRSKTFVIQSSLGSGGNETIVLSSSNDNNLINTLHMPYVIASEYYSKSLPVNQHLIITLDNVYCLPLSIQIIEKTKRHRLVYRGGDFSSAASIPPRKQKEIREYGLIIGKLLSSSGYRGCVGIDYLIYNNQVWFIEINPRFQSSSRLLNENLIGKGYPSLYELHIKAFEEQPVLIPDTLEANGAFYFLNHQDLNQNINLGLQELYSPDSRTTLFSKDQISLSIESNSLKNNKLIEPKIHRIMIQVNRGITAYSSQTGVVLNYSIINYLKKRPSLIKKVKQKDIHACARLKFDLFSYGIQLSKNALQKLSEDRDNLTIRDGIAGGLELSFNDIIHVNTPIKEFFALISPYNLDYDFSKKCFLIKDQHGDSLVANVLPIPDFVGLKTSKGTPMVEVGQMHNERLSIEVVFGCKNNLKNQRACHFCELGAEPEIKYTSIEDIQELVTYCEKSDSINMRHILIGGGTPPEDQWYFFLEVLAAVKKITDLPIYMMIAPPKDLSRLKELKKLGLNEVAFNLELYNRKIAIKIMPEKGRIARHYYLKAMDMAVDLWGGNGNIRSILIVGLEPLEQTLQGVELLASHGVMPILSPFRPVPGTRMASHPQAHSELLYEAWNRGEEIASKYGLTLGPTCIACQNNTIALPFNPICHYY